MANSEAKVLYRSSKTSAESFCSPSLRQSAGRYSLRAIAGCDLVRRCCGVDSFTTRTRRSHHEHCEVFTHRTASKTDRGLMLPLRGGENGLIRASRHSEIALAKGTSSSDAEKATWRRCFTAAGEDARACSCTDTSCTAF